MEVLRQRQDDLQFVQMRHEEAAAFAAVAYARLTGRLGVCLATTGPGGVHLLNGLYDAKLDQVPILAIPADTQNEPMSAPRYSTMAQPHHTSSAYSVPAVNPRPEDVQRAAEVLHAGHKVAILIGGGAREARHEVAQVAELPGAPIAVACPTPSTRQVVAFVGDGGLTMLQGHLTTLVKYDLPVKVVVLKNNVLGMIRWEQLMWVGSPEYGIELQDIDFVKIAEGFGLKAFRAERPR